MTRFARAHGSKSSNERLPEEATSWQDLKRQLVEAQQQHQQEEIPRKHILNKNDFQEDDNQEWAEFERRPAKKEKKRKLKVQVEGGESFYSKLKKEENKDGESRTNTAEIQRNKKQKNRKVGWQDKQGNQDYECQTFAEEKIAVIQENQKQMKRAVVSQDSEEGVLTQGEHKRKRKKSKKDKTKQDVIKKHVEEDVQTHSKSPNISEEKISQGVGNLKKSRNEPDCSKRHQKNGKVHKRRKPDEGHQSMFINGQEITIMKFDGFPVKKEDHARLKELRQKLVAKGIPQNEIKQVMKLERRKAEKALAREKKKVCFHCRRPGHNLSECPGLGDDQNQNAQSSGICFKCGSTEHTHYQCRVNRSEGFQFAKCFICNEQGHIARQCPDNPRGLYPKGGACRVCGDVTHLKKDCPDLVKEKQDQTMTVETLKSGALEALDEELKGQQPKTSPVKKQKRVTF